MKRVVILQPSYIPWLGYFDQISKSDIFVFYDDVQYTRRDWRNRNRIKLLSGQAHFLTVPVKVKGSYEIPIKDVQIDNTQKWQKKHLNAFVHNYKKASFFEEGFYLLESALSKSFEKLTDLDEHLTKEIASYLGIKTVQYVQSSSLSLSYTDSTDHLIKLCKHFDATHYLTGDSAQDYLDEESFKDNKLILEYHNYHHSVYQQLSGEFISHLSIVDLLFNYGKGALSIVRGRQTSNQSSRTEKGNVV